MLYICLYVCMCVFHIYKKYQSNNTKCTQTHRKYKTNSAEVQKYMLKTAISLTLKFRNKS